MFGKVRRSSTMFGGLAVIVALTGFVAVGAQAADPSNSENAKACQNGGWEDLARNEDYSGFSNSGDCVSYAAQGGTLVNPLALCKQQLADAGLTEPANANYILGTPGNDDFSSLMTARNDVVCGFSGNDEIGVPPSNVVLSAGDIFLGGDDRDRLYKLQGGTFEGGPGDDHVSFIESGTFHGGAGNDSVNMLVGGTFNGGDDDDRVSYMQGGTFNGDDDHDDVAEYCGGTYNSVEEVYDCDS